MRQRFLLFVLLAPFAVNAQEVKYSVSPLDVRPAGTDFAPVIVDSSVVFCSLRERDRLTDYSSAETGAALSDLYRMRVRGGAPGKPMPLSDAINTEVNDGPATFTDGGRLICFTRNLKRAKELDGGDDDGNLGLFFSQYTEGGWSEATPFQHNDPEHNTMHAAFSSDGERLVFSSDADDGADLFVCDRNGNSWSKPRPLARNINSSSKELFPFLDDNGGLYFASDRPGGAGGLDIWQCRPVEGGWSTPQVLPSPINSTGNDLGFTCYPGGLSGYFSSDRNGDDLLFRFDREVPLFVNCTPQQTNNYCYVFREQASMRTAGLPLTYRWDLGDGRHVDDLVARHCYNSPGTYIVSLDIIDTINKALFFREASYTLVIEDIQQSYITLSDSARTGSDVTLDARRSFLPGADLVAWYWDFGDSTRSEGADVQHSFRGAGTYTVRLDALSRPHENGAVRNHCVTRQVVVIDRFKDALDAPVEVNYQAADGGSREFAYQELASDQFELTVKEGDDVRFSVELFRSRERLSLDDPRFEEIRKHYPLIERYDPVSSTYIYSVGEVKELGELYEVYAKVKELKFLDAMVMAVEMEKVLDMSQLASLDAQQLNNTVLRVSNVLFETGKHTFEPIFETQLTEVLGLVVKHAQLRLVIEAHTDDQGGDETNMQLSQRRAQSVTDWFLARGIDPDRLVAVGHGENKPLGPNTDEIRRSLNRRVEFRLAVESADQAVK